MKKMSKILSVFLAVVMAMSALVITSNAAEATNKVELTLQSAGAEVFSAALKSDYSFELSIPNDAVVDANQVTLGLSMTDVDAFGIEGTKTFSKTFVTGVDKQVELYNYLPDFDTATLQGTIDGVDYKYNLITGSTDEIYSIEARPKDKAAAEAAFDAFFSHTTVREQDIKDNYIIIPGDAYIQVGTEKLVFEDTDGFLFVDNITSDGSFETEVRYALKVEEAEELDYAQVEIHIPEGTIIALGESFLMFDDSATITIYGYDDVDEINTILSQLAACESNEQIILTLVQFLQAVVGAVNGNTITLDAEFHVHTVEEGKAPDEYSRPTCDTDGSYVYYCDVCGKVAEIDVVPALGHEFGEWVVLKDATCTEEGVLERECSVCGDFEYETIEVIGHNYEASYVIEPDCDDEGYTVYECTECGDSYEADFTDALGHTAGEAVVENRVEPDCETDGSYDSVVYCTVCGEEISREEVVIEATGHDMELVEVVAPTYIAKGYSIYVCSVCGHEEFKDYTDMLPPEVLDVEALDSIVIKYEETYDLGSVVADKVVTGGEIGYTISYSSAAANVAEVDANGVITGKGMGKTVITVTVTDDNGKSVSEDVNVQVKFSIANWFTLIWQILKVAFDVVIGGLFGSIVG